MLSTVCLVREAIPLRVYCKLPQSKFKFITGNERTQPTSITLNPVRKPASDANTGPQSCGWLPSPLASPFRLSLRIEPFSEPNGRPHITSVYDMLSDAPFREWPISSLSRFSPTKFPTKKLSWILCRNFDAESSLITKVIELPVWLAWQNAIVLVCCGWEDAKVKWAMDVWIPMFGRWGEVRVVVKFGVPDKECKFVKFYLGIISIETDILITFCGIWVLQWKYLLFLYNKCCR